jgi:hypothetical protein
MDWPFVQMTVDFWGTRFMPAHGIIRADSGIRFPRRAVFALIGCLIGCGAPRPPEYERPPESWKEAVGRADAALDALKTELLQKLLEEINKGDLGGALRACGEAAGTLARRAGERYGVEIGRTSHRLRNPSNAPRPWARPYVESAPGRPAEEIGVRYYDLGNRIGVLRPIWTGPLCLKCHGGSPPADVAAALRRLYPEDRATGFRENELRGFFWVEVPR